MPKWKFIRFVELQTLLMYLTGSVLLWFGVWRAWTNGKAWAAVIVGAILYFSVLRMIWKSHNKEY